jgi:hypothetical protein
MSQGLELDLGREVERRLEAQAGALQGLLRLARGMLELAEGPQLEAARLTELVHEDERFFGRLQRLQEGLSPLRERWLAENPDHERRGEIELAARKVHDLIRELVGVQEDLRSRLSEAQGQVAAELGRLPRRAKRAPATRRKGRLLSKRVV